jgi:hypothetical protein
MMEGVRDRKWCAVIKVPGFSETPVACHPAPQATHISISLTMHPQHRQVACDYDDQVAVPNFTTRPVFGACDSNDEVP